MPAITSLLPKHIQLLPLRLQVPVVFGCRASLQMDSRKRQRTESPSPCSLRGGKEDPDGEKLYFDSYAMLGIHEAMLRDTVRTEGYYNAIMHHKARFQNKVVIDVGCGTGILSIFCAWAGAKHVYAIEASGMAEHARNVVKENGLEGTVTVVHGKVEDIELEDSLGLPVAAHVIISEWMGYFLYYESMLESVLLARDRWLVPEGILFPSHAVLYLCPLTDDQYYSDRVLFWQSVYGASMSSLFDHAKHCAFDNVIIDTVHPFQCFAFPEIIKFIDCRNCTIEEVQNFKVPPDSRVPMPLKWCAMGVPRLFCQGQTYFTIQGLAGRVGVGLPGWV